MHHYHLKGIPNLLSMENPTKHSIESVHGPLTAHVDTALGEPLDDLLAPQLEFVVHPNIPIGAEANGAAL